MVIQVAETVVLDTSEGVIEVELDRRRAPVTVENFVNYVKSGFYDGTVFHRVMKGFMVQAGGFTPDGIEKPTAEPIGLEADNGLKNTAGTIAMARTDEPASATSQFFISLIDNDFLNPSAKSDGYAVFGKVTKGFEVVKKIGEAKTSSRGYNDDWPVKDILIKKARMKD